MKPEQQRIAIAEACGWKLVEDNPDYEPYWEDPKGNMIAKVGFQNRLPDYLNDLNAMHEAEKALNELSWMHYLRNLAEIVRKPKQCEIQISQYVHATAAQRAEAFLRTLNLWTDTP